MAKVLRTVAVVAGAVALFATGVGALAGVGVLGTGLTATVIGAAAAGVAKVAGLVALGASLGASTLQRKPKFEAGGITGRLSLSEDVEQWLVIGQTAMPAQMIYWGTSGGDNKTLSIIAVHACHRIASFDSLKINDIDTAFPTPGGDYAGILSIQTATGAHTSNPFTSVEGGQWGASTPGRELAMSHFRWTYDEEKLRSGLPQNIQFIGKGIHVYDPRRDSTRGGSGSMRANDESTWAYNVGGTDLGNNPALVHLTYRLGWRKNGRLWAGMGEDPANINFAEYIAAANICDETVEGARRYTIGGILSLADLHNINLGKILSCCAGRGTDAGGLLGIWVAHDDTAVAAMTFGPGDVVGDIAWEALPDQLNRNTARGSFLDPGNNYTAQPYPEVRPSDLLSLDNSAEQVDRVDFPMVTNVRQSQRLASIRLRESRQGVLDVPLRLKALGLKPAQVFALNLPQQGWAGKRFRVEGMTITGDLVRVRARAVAPGDYADGSTTVVTPATPPTTGGFVPTFEDGATRNEDGGGNLIAAPADSSTWIFIGGGQASDAVAATLNGRTAQMLAAGDGVIWGNEVFPVTPGETLFFRHVVGCDSGVPAGAVVFGGFNFFDRNGTLLAGAAGAVNADGSEVSAAQALNTAFRAEGRCIVSAGAAFARAYTIRTGGAGGSFYANQARAARDAVGADPTGATLPTLARGNWEAGRFYVAGTIVQFNAGIYSARFNHTSDNSNAPPSASVWVNIGSTGPGTSSAGISFVANSTSYGAAGAQITVQAGATGNVDLTASMAVDADPNNTADYGAAGKWQRDISGVWTDVAAETIAPGLAYPGGPGTSLDVNATAGGLTPSTSYTFRLLLRRTGAGPGTDVVNLVGQATGNGR